MTFFGVRRLDAAFVRGPAALLPTLASLCLFASAFAQTKPTTAASGPAMAETRPVSRPIVRFVALDIYVDSKDRPLAAYQFELTAVGAPFAIVGVEGGVHQAFVEPPYYDPAALSKNRIILAAFNTGKDLPTGKTRIARIHARVIGEKDPSYAVKLVVAATADGSRIPATATIAPGEKP